MRKEYDFTNAIKNPYAKKLKKKISMNVDEDVIDYYKKESISTGVPYQTLMHLTLKQCADSNKKLQVSLKWELSSNCVAGKSLPAKIY